MARFTLNMLEKIVAERADVSDGSSYTASLIACGVEKCAQKMGEEAVEAAIAASVKNTSELTKEAADLLYHLLVVLKVSDIPLKNVMDELDRRTAQTGLQEKDSRPIAAAAGKNKKVKSSKPARPAPKRK